MAAMSGVPHTCSIVPQECCHLIHSQGQRQILHCHMPPINLQASSCFQFEQTRHYDFLVLPTMNLRDFVTDFC